MGKTVFDKMDKDTVVNLAEQLESDLDNQKIELDKALATIEDYRKSVPGSIEVVVDRLYGCLAFLKNTRTTQEINYNDEANQLEQIRASIIVKSDEIAEELADERKAEDELDEKERFSREGPKKQ